MIDVAIRVNEVSLPGDLEVPSWARGAVMFAHGSGSSRRSPRNVRVAAALNERGFATLLFDLLTEDEERVDRATAELRFDIPLLAGRLVAALDQSGDTPGIEGLPIGCFGASTGAAAALAAGSERPEAVRAVVSRGGRPDLAGAALEAVRAPTLLIVGGFDPEVLELNRAAMTKIPSEVRLEIVPGATHLFEEPGALEEVAGLAGDWFEEHLKTP